ncbi:hypothetical protein [uncultured Aquimarina sp.]|uniref:hypothetical protein n=1 Tax=uncultured Aquimarina sp. TaxID=575652 RepID=UPI0026238655|nr:hypothetical protein [uncultured Aquimarina sp.]
MNCNSKQKKERVELQTPKSNVSELNGVWGLNNYFDNILADKQIAKYRLQPPTWFAILLEIKNDSLKSYGSIIELNYKLNYNSDTLAVFNSFGGKYALFKEKDKLLLTQFPNQERIDSTKYVFGKRNDLKSLLENQDRVHKISSSITNYFNENLIAGTYANLKSSTNVIFEKNGKLKNFKDFDKYEVRNYFGTSHPHKNMDVVTLVNSMSKERKQFNWKFENEELILTEFVRDNKTDYFLLGNNKIVLKLKNH